MKNRLEVLTNYRQKYVVFCILISMRVKWDSENVRHIQYKVWASKLFDLISHYSDFYYFPSLIFRFIT